jgi:hypothetical protein
VQCLLLEVTPVAAVPEEPQDLGGALTILGRINHGGMVIALRRILAAAGTAAVLSGLAAWPAWAVDDGYLLFGEPVPYRIPPYTPAAGPCPMEDPLA